MHFLSLSAPSRASTVAAIPKRTACTDDERRMQVYDYEYDLILRPDINTRGHTQWFYFSVSNTVHNVPYKFNIINMVKSDSLYQDGMQPLVFSEKEAVAHGKMWKRSGSNISYYQVRPRVYTWGAEVGARWEARQRRKLTVAWVVYGRAEQHQAEEWPLLLHLHLHLPVFAQPRHCLPRLLLPVYVHGPATLPAASGGGPQMPTALPSPCVVPGE